jgi:hypothetical protein
MALQSITPIATITLQQATSTVTFSGIPDTYRDLVFTFNGSGAASQPIYFRFNNDFGANYPSIRMYNTAADAQTPPEIGFGNTNLVATVQVFDYSVTDKHKTSLIRWGNADGTSYVMAWATRWANTAKIHTININSASGNLAAGATFSLYGRVA